MPEAHFVYSFPDFSALKVVTTHRPTAIEKPDVFSIRHGSKYGGIAEPAGYFHGLRALEFNRPQDVTGVSIETVSDNVTAEEAVFKSSMGLWMVVNTLSPHTVTAACPHSGIGVRQRTFSLRTTLHCVGASPSVCQLALGPEACGQLANALSMVMAGNIAVAINNLI